MVHTQMFSAARKTVEMINRIYPLRKCDKLKKELCLILSYS